MTRTSFFPSTFLDESIMGEALLADQRITGGCSSDGIVVAQNCVGDLVIPLLARWRHGLLGYG